MIRTALLTLGFLAIIAPAGMGEAPLALDECYRLALARSETLELSEEDIRQAEGRYAQLRARVFPRAELRASELVQDTSGVPPSTGVGGTLTRRTRPEARIAANQLLFAGFRELLSLKGLKAEIAGKSLERRRAEQLLFEDVARAFYNVVEMDRRRQTLGSLKQSTLKRLEELEGRVRIGRSRRSEVLSVESQLAALEARMEEAAGLRVSALELLSFLAGRTVADVADAQPDIVEPAPLEDYLSRVPSRPDVLAAGRNVEASGFYRQSARRARWPTLNLDGNYYLKRVGFNEPIDWDLLFSATLPLSTGGEHRGSVLEAESRARAAEIRRSRLQRQAETDVRRVHEELVSSLAQAAKLKEAVDKAERNVTVQSEEYRLGLTNNLEVLSALSALQEARLSYDRVRLDVKLNGVRLDVAAGTAMEDGGAPQ
ncbi:MAG: TolC family protein [Elusimicrobia bacterium]|nr:TolC family protein [Elusimicrobiota bacterium]